MIKIRESTGGGYEKRGQFFIRVTVAPQKRQAEHAPWATTLEAVVERGKLVQGWVNRLRAAEQTDFIETIVERGAAASDAVMLDALARKVEVLVGDHFDRVEPTKKTGGPLTFRTFAEQWTDGDLARLHPDHIDVKSSVQDDVERLTKHVYPHVEDVPLVDFTRAHADGVMAKLDPSLRRNTRRHVASLIGRILHLAVFVDLIKHSPLPPGWLPKAPSSDALGKESLLPSEEAMLLRGRDAAGKVTVPLEYRVAYLFLHREGMRKGEAKQLTWPDLDTARGMVSLDENKTDDPRAWALSPDVVRVLTWWRKRTDRGEDTDLVLGVTLGDGAWLLRGDSHFDPSKPDTTINRRGDLRTAGVARRELFERTPSRQPLRLHDFRALFVTASLANGKTEQWVTDRTGHKSSQQVALYTRQARTWAELELGALRPLDELLPEIAGETRTPPVEEVASPPLPSPAPVIGRRLDGDESPLGDLNPRPALYESAALPLS